MVGTIMMASTSEPDRMPAPAGAASPKMAFTSAFDHVEAEDAVDDRRDAHEQLDEGLEDAAAEATGDLHDEDR